MNKTLAALTFFVSCSLLGILSQESPDRKGSLFKPSLAESPIAKKAFRYIQDNREKIIGEWIRLTEIPAPSGQETRRAATMKKEFLACGLDDVRIDKVGNVLGIWQGKKEGRNILISAHMDTVFQGVLEVKVKREDDVLKAPGVGDDTASLINLLWSIRALKEAGFEPMPTYYFLATVEEEMGFKGMRAFLEAAEEKFDCVIALDDDLGKVHYGALGFGGGKVTFRGPGAHTMESKGVPNPNLSVAKAVERICRIPLPSEPSERWTVINIGMIGGGRVRNAVSQESWFTLDLRSADQEELEKAQAEIKKICQEVALDTGVDVEFELNEESRASQISGAGDSFLVKTVVAILEYLQVKDIEVDPLGSTEANAAIEKGILAVNLGRTYGRYKHSLREEADIEGLFLAQKQILLLLFSLN